MQNITEKYNGSKRLTLFVTATGISFKRTDCTVLSALLMWLLKLGAKVSICSPALKKQRLFLFCSPKGLFCLTTYCCATTCMPRAGPAGLTGTTGANVSNLCFLIGGSPGGPVSLLVVRCPQNRLIIAMQANLSYLISEIIKNLFL